MKNNKNRVFIMSLRVLITALLAAAVFYKGAGSQRLMIGIMAVWVCFVLIRLAYSRFDKWKLLFPWNQAAVDTADPKKEDVQPDPAVMTILLRQVEGRITDNLKYVYPEATWEWTIENPIRLALNGGTGRIRTYNTGENNYADITIDKFCRMNLYLMNVSELKELAVSKMKAENQGAEKQGNVKNSPYDTNLWFQNSGQQALNGIITDLNARGHSGLSINEKGEIFITEKGVKKSKAASISDFPDQKHWPDLITLLESLGLNSKVVNNNLTVNW